MKTLNILLVEDSPLDAELIEAYLVDGGLEFSLLCVETREDFVVALETHCYDIILADYILPCFNGISSRTQLITQNSRLQALSSKESAKN